MTAGQAVLLARRAMAIPGHGADAIPAPPVVWSLIFASLFTLSSISRADTTASGDTQITGQVGVGTQVPYARMHVQDDGSEPYAVRVSSANGSVLFLIQTNGNIGLGLSVPQTHLDVNGTADNNDRALQLRVGNSSNTALSQQIVFASTAGTYGHSLVTQHTAGQTL